MLSRCVRKVARWLKQEAGLTAVEYAVIIGLVAVVVVAGIAILGNGSEETFNSVYGTTVGTTTDLQ